MSASESEILFDELNLAANDGQTDTEYSFVLSETDSDIGETQTDGKVQRSSTPINKDILPVKNVLVTFDFPEKKVDHIDVMKIVNFDLIIGKKMENLAWTKQTLVERMDCMLTSGFGSDVKFVFTDQNGKPSGEEEVKAHKCILMSGTQHFSNGTHFAHQAEQCQVEVPTTLGFGRDAIFTMLKYIYTDALPSNGANAISEFTAANYYGVPVLEDYCFGMLKNSMKLENVFFILIVSMRSAGKQEEILQFIDSNAEEIIYTGEFFKIGTDVLEILLQRNLKADEFQIYRAVKQWAEEQCRKDGVDNPTGEELRAKLLGPKDLLHLIRFPLIDAKTLASEIRESDILNANELMNILCWKYTKEDAIVSPFLTQTRYQQ